MKDMDIVLLHATANRRPPVGNWWMLPKRMKAPGMLLGDIHSSQEEIHHILIIAVL